MATLAEVKKGTYKSYCGPVFWGSVKVSDPGVTEGGKFLVVTSTTEGGRWDSGQAYDSCRFTAGGIQYCERFFLVSGLLNAIGNRSQALLTPLQDTLANFGAEFKKGRFHLNGKEVKTDKDQCNLFFKGGTGLQGSWTDDAWQQGSEIVVAVANVLAQPEAIDVQKAYTLPRLKGFAIKEAAKVLFGGGEPSVGWVGAIRAAYISFAANNPTLAYNAFTRVFQESGEEVFSEAWCVRLLEALTFSSGVVIYPERYNKIRPVIERLFGVDLPDHASQLKTWEEGMGSTRTLTTPVELQEALITLGYDLGPAGADGKVGKKTTEAVKAFQSQRGLVSDGLVGPQTRTALLQALEAVQPPSQ